VTLSAWLKFTFGLALALALAWGARVDHLRAGWRAKYETLSGEAGELLGEVRTATEQPRLKWADAPAATRALGNSRRVLRVAITTQNAAIDAQAREALALRAEAEQLQAIARRAEAQRRTAVLRLEELAARPGADPATLAGCQQLLAEAEAALDLVREAGL
jgi:hypothetical protein